MKNKIRNTLDYKKPLFWIIILVLAMFFVLAGYLISSRNRIFTNAVQEDNNKLTNNEPETEIYVMQDSHSEILSPSIGIDKEKCSFSFSFDALSSYVNCGNIEIKEDKIIATTDDGKYTYIFKMINNNTLEFIEAGSSSTKTIEGKIAVPDGSKFVIK